MKDLMKEYGRLHRERDQLFYHLKHEYGIEMIARSLG